jgi:hypothetical protein
MTATNQPDLSPAPGIIPGPVRVHDDPAPPTASTEKRDSGKPGQRNPFRIAFTRVMSALHGDKYMVDAYPAAGLEAAAPSDAESRAR